MENSLFKLQPISNRFLKASFILSFVFVVGCSGFAVNPQKTRLFIVCDDGRVIQYESWGTEADAILLTQAFDGCIATEANKIKPIDYSDMVMPGAEPKVNVVPFPETEETDRDTMRP